MELTFPDWLVVAGYGAVVLVVGVDDREVQAPPADALAPAVAEGDALARSRLVAQDHRGAVGARLGRGPVARPVVDHDDLIAIRWKILLDQALDAVVQEPRTIASRHHN